MSQGKVSTFELTLMMPLVQHGLDFGRRQLEILVYVDGKEVNAGASWEFDGIYAAAMDRGHFFLSNCGCCGHAGCAGVYWPAIVEHKGGMIHWLIPRQPWSNAPNIPRRVRFDRAAYRAECDRFAALLDECCRGEDAAGMQSVVTGHAFSIKRFMCQMN